MNICVCLCANMPACDYMAFISVSVRAEQELIFPPGHSMTTLGTSKDASKGKKVCFKVTARAHTHKHTNRHHICLWSCLVAASSNCESQRKGRQNCLYTSRLVENIKLWVCAREFLCTTVCVCACLCVGERLIFCCMMRRGRNVWMCGASKNAWIYFL